MLRPKNAEVIAMSPSNPQAQSKGAIPITCIYCGHTWSESIAELEKQDRVIYREDPGGDPPARTAEYLVQCPNCGRRMTVTVRIKGA